ncbi:MAG: serine/threonine protein kinase [Chitinispirillales bacterium]|jgi:serine/threonine protein kinase|nr:serine/threonine protein kinase [Chitinispirillales bacterium]
MQIFNESEVEKTFVDRTPLSWDDTGAGERGVSAQTGSTSQQQPIAPHRAIADGDGSPLHRPIVGKTLLGSGLVTDTIGAGGMASIYLVWNERLEMFRAVKMLSQDALYGRFETEVKITAKLRHQNIVEIYSVGEWNGLPYMEMEYINGENLQQILNSRGRFPEAVCCAAAISIANALHYAHSLNFTLSGKPYHGVIHRDLKPANIMFSKDAVIKLTDFGIARPAEASLHTIDGNIVGTLHYLSPEQMEGKNVDHRSDIYSFGTLIYEMATGTRAFPQDSVTELMRQRVANSFKKLTEYDFKINAALSNIIHRCLERDPKDRYPDMLTLLNDLQKTLASFTAMAPEKILTSFYPEADANTVYTRTDVETPTVKMPSSQISLNISLKKATIILPLILLAILAISHISAKQASQKILTQMQNLSQQPLPADQSAPDNLSGNDQDAADEDDVAAEPEPKTVTEQKTYAPPVTAPNPRTAAAPAPAPSSTRPPVPTPAPARPLSEDDLIRIATDAVNRKDWDLAIRTLEQSGVYNTKRDLRALLLLEAYVESKRLDRAAALLDIVARTNDAHYFLTAGKYWFYKRNYAESIRMLEASLTRSSILRSRNAIFDDAMYYIAMARSERFKAAPSDANRLSALDGWKRVQSVHVSRPGSQRFKKAEEEIAALNF